MKSLRRRLTYANVMSTLAVFLVLGGATAFAAVELAKNSVGTKQLRKNAVTAAKLKKNAVTSAKIADGAVNGSKVAPGSLTGADIDASTLGTVPRATQADSAGTASSLGPLPSGKSLSGFYAAAGGLSVGGYAGDGITFQQPLAAPIPEGNVEYIAEDQEFTSACPGPGRAAPNHLCLYSQQETNLGLCCIYDSEENSPAAGRNGFVIYWILSGAQSFADGEWTVTAP